ncbi:hypothetical protein VDG1235_2456 [Verrucomicrobiia bacterium DG1235]|nr:hypothetical protein VDG1235_2456 [Verrucomicrobiae bacterium DG1235]
MRTEKVRRSKAKKGHAKHESEGPERSEANPVPTTTFKHKTRARVFFCDRRKERLHGTG